jgi:hypothetical protein
MSDAYDSFVAPIDLSGARRSRFLLQDANDVTHQVTVMGTMLYVRKDQRSDMVGGIAIPDIAYKDVEVQGSELGDLYHISQPLEDVNTAVVLAVGPDVDHTRIVAPLRIGQRVMVDSDGQAGIFRSPWSYCDYFLDVSSIICVLEEDA